MVKRFAFALALLVAAPLVVDQAAAQSRSGIANPSFLGQGTGAIGRTFQERGREIVYGKDYGVKCDNATDDGPAIQLAVNALVASSARGGAVVMPQGQCKIGTQVSVTTNNICLRGQGMYATALTVTSTTLNPILATSVTRFCMEDIGLTGPGATSTSVGVQLTNTYESRLARVAIDRFNINVQFSPGANSSYSNAIWDSYITLANTTNINAQASTNSLRLYHVTFGGSPAQYGLKVVDSTDMQLFGGNCEGVSVSCIDLDATTDSPNFSGYIIDGLHMENNTSSAGDIRVGNTNPLYGGVIRGTFFSAGAGATYPVYLNKATSWTLMGNVVPSGYTTRSSPFLGTVSNISSIGNRWALAEGYWHGLHFTTATDPMMKIGGTANNVAPSSTLEVQGTSGITMSRDSLSTGVGAKYNFRQKDANGTWLDYAYIQGSLSAVTAGATTAEVKISGNVAGADTALLIVDNTGIRTRTRTFAGLGAETNGTFVYCSDCTIANPCAGAGTGAFAKRLAGAWVCD